jgi:glutamate-1-semialdehyde 2,1-aminomutase
MFGFVFSADAPVRSYAQVAGADVERFRRFFHRMLDAGIYLAPSAFEAGFVSSAHGEAEIEQTLAAAAGALQGL